MTSDSWIGAALGRDRIAEASIEAGRRRLRSTLGLSDGREWEDDELRFVANGLELRVFDLLDEEPADELRQAATEAFQVFRSLPWPSDAMEAGAWLVRLGCLSVLGDRAADFRRTVQDVRWPRLSLDHENWGDRVWASVLEIWLRLLRKKGWEDLDAVQGRVAALRTDQSGHEPGFLRSLERSGNPSPALRLIAEYHLARAAEILAIYLSQGSLDGRFDVRQQMEAQFDRAISVAERAQLIELETFTRLLSRTAATLVDNSIWNVTRAVNSRVTRFVETLTSRANPRPFFEMLPPQRKTLREEGLLGSGHRSVVVSLPTSSGKTFIAEFRMLQALNQFDQEKGWIAYLAPTRALVNQLTVRLRRDFAPLNIIVEKVSPALEIDALETGLLTESEVGLQFRILVTTPEKLDLLLRGGWEQIIGRPLTLVVVDEAHNLASSQRGLKLELLLATINRECRNAQFLLLTPFIHNAAEIARWLSPESNKNIELGLDWAPNDRVIAISRPRRGQRRGSFTIDLKTQQTSKHTLSIPEILSLPDQRPLGLSWSNVSNSQGKLAAATAQILQSRGTIVILADKPDNTWGIASAFKVPENRIRQPLPEVEHIRRFLAAEMGPQFPLIELLNHGVGVHHAGLSDDSRALIEWLTEHQCLRVLVATTTIAQGVNYPVAGVVFASHQYPYGQDMPPEDFWNIAGRAGRIDQGDLGIVVLAATTDQKAEQLQTFVNRNVVALNSTLIDMVRKAIEQGTLLNLESLAWQPGWSAFLQYLAHTYRLMGDHDRFAQEVEQVLRGTLGFQALRRSHRGWAEQLVRSVYRYSERIQGKPLKLVDLTGFSWESVNATLARLSAERIRADVWSLDLFGRNREKLRQMMGILLQVPELRTQLQEVTGGDRPDGDKLARMVSDWVQGRSLTEMASEYFAQGSEAGEQVAAMTRCCRNIFGRLTQTASWGLSALQSLTLGDALEDLAEPERRSVKNLPAKVYYGVNTDAAITLRLLNVPRIAAEPMSRQLDVRPGEPLASVRARIRATNPESWTAALGAVGASVCRVWSILEGEP